MKETHVDICTTCANYISAKIPNDLCFVCNYYNSNVDENQFEEKVVSDAGNPKLMAQNHWDYIEQVLNLANVSQPEIEVIGFHYKTAAVHFYGHGVEDTKNGIS